MKVWRTPVSSSKTMLEKDDIGIEVPNNSMPKAFAGRNCLLGSLMDATFTSITVISEWKAILCTAQGDICMLDDSHQTQRLERVARVDFGILCVVFDHIYDLVWVGGRQGTMRCMHLNTLIKPTVSSLQPGTITSSSSSSFETLPDIIAIGFVRGRIITIDSHRVFEIRGLVNSAGVSVIGSASKRLPAHESAVLGVSDLLSKSTVDGPDFLTFSARGSILFWRLDGTCTGSMKIPLDQPIHSEDSDINTVKVVVPLGSDEHLLSGDKMGVLR